MASLQTHTPHKRRTIAYFNHEIGKEWTLRPWWGIEDAAMKHDVHLISCFGDRLGWPFSYEEQSNVVYALARSQRIDGLILWKASIATNRTEEEIETFCRSYGVPVVTMEGPMAGARCVSYDNRQAIQDVIAHLIDTHGFRRIGFLGCYENHFAFKTRYQAYLDLMQERGLPIDPALVRGWVRDEDTVGGSPVQDAVVQEYLEGALNAGVEAIATAFDEAAIQVIRLLQKRGIRVPEDVAVVGFDGFNDSRAVTPPLTTVLPAWYQLGSLAVETLIDILDGRPGPDQVKVPHQLKLRQSCGCPDASVRAAGRYLGGKPGKTARTFDPAEAAAQMVAALTLPAEAGDLPAVAEQLARSFLNEISQDQPGEFMHWLDAFMEAVKDRSGKISACQDALTHLRVLALPVIKRSRLQYAETLLQQARIQIGKTAEREQALLRISSEARLNRLLKVGQALITSFDLDHLLDVLVEKLPSLDIPSGYLAFFEAPIEYRCYKDPAPPFSRLVLAFNPQGRAALPAGGLHYPTHQILPDAFWREDRAYNYILQALSFQDHLIGYMAFEAGSREGSVYDILRGKISSALQGHFLVQRIGNRAVQLQTVAEVSQTTTNLLDLNELVGQVVELVRERFNLYYVGLFLLDNDRRWAVLQAGTGPAGRNMLEAGHRLEIGGNSMVSNCILQNKAAIALDVNQEAVRFDNPLLPETHSEMALPLTSRGHAIGALTVQSSRVSAFSEDDITIMQTMADQVANAISNAWLFEQVEQRASELAQAKEAADQARYEAEAEQEAAEKAREEAEIARREAEEANHKLARQIWQTTGQALLNERMRGEQDTTTLAKNIIQQLCRYLNAQAGAIYLASEETLKLTSTYAYPSRGFQAQVQLGESQVGQSALERAVLATAVPDEYITSVFKENHELLPKYILTGPLDYNGQLVGAFEIHAMTDFSELQLEFLNQASESIVIAFTTAIARKRVNELLFETSQQAEELQAQEEELRATNEELEMQAETLRASEAKLILANSELEEKAFELQENSLALKEKQAVLDRQNYELRMAQQSLEQKAVDLAMANRYKSEFLANMSHELRTPLNSLLILASLLAKNEDGNLTPEQVESARIIYSGGSDLLTLINEILDLSKVEAGKMEFRSAPVLLEPLAANLRTQFGLIAEEKKLAFSIQIAPDLPDTIETDRQRLEQILRNLLSNAFKFTSQGGVQVEIYRPGPQEDLSQSGLDPQQTAAFRVKDTGIGIPPEKQQMIFEAFQQADGSTSRQYGGTGLGLTISRQLALRLGGHIRLDSTSGQGSTFTLYLPFKRPATHAAPEALSKAPKPPDTAPLPTIEPAPPARLPASEADDDRANLYPDDRVLLVIEDDRTFARLVYDYSHKKRFKCLLAYSGEEGMRLVHSYRVDAIILDLTLPGMSGWEVLDRIKEDPDRRHIPIHIISAADIDINAYLHGAMGFLSKPVNPEAFDTVFQQIERFIARSLKSLLLVEDDENLRKSVHRLLEGNDVQITEAGSGGAALEQLARQRFDCMILDLTLPDMSGFDVLNQINSQQSLHRCPIIVYTGKDLSEEESQELMKYADSIIIKGVKSQGRLLDETALFLHRVIASMPEDKQIAIKQLHNHEAIYQGKEILIVDDDARNAFALSKLLSSKGMRVYIAPNGQKALDLLKTTPIKLVLMDIMLPGMDGYEVIRRIRAEERFRGLPILAQTAKAMKGDREKCISAGADDYLSKPIDAGQLFSLLQVWLSKDLIL